MRNSVLHPRFIGAMAGCVLLTSAVPAYALPSPSRAAVSYTAAARAEQIDRIMNVLTRREVQWHLRLTGLNATRLREQLAQLDDAQLAAVAARAETVRAAGDPLIIIGVSLGSVVLLALAVLLVIFIIHESEQNKAIQHETK